MSAVAFSYPSLSELLATRRRESPEVPAFMVRSSDEYVSVSWAEAGRRMDAIAAGLLAMFPLAEDARIAIVGNASLEWLLTDFAALSVGLQTVPIYASLLPDEIAYMLADTGAQIVVVEDRAQLEKVRRARRGGTLGDRPIPAESVKVRRIVVVRAEGVAEADDWESLETLEARGRAALEETAAERSRRAALSKRDHLATFTYTSGTTGAPKAVIQTHGNMLSMLEAADALGLFKDGVRRHGLFLFLPPAHSFGRLIELAGPYFGAPIVLSSVPTLGEDLALSAPGFFPSAPRVYEKMKLRIESAVAAASPIRRALFRWALAVGEKTIELRSHGRPLPLTLRIRAAVARRLVWSKLHRRLGLHRAELLLSGSAPLSPQVHRFFLALGLDLVEAYGLTETCPGLTSNTPNNFRVGTVGRAFPGIELRVAPDGEVLARGPNITAGYLNRPEATAEAFEDGWFKTGDLGAIDADGFLTITGRKKELIKTSGGKYVVPAKIEEMLKRHPLIQEAVVIGDARNYCVCLVVPDPELLAEVTRDHAETAVAQHVEKVNAELASFETMKAFRIVDEPFSVDNQLLTASLKVRRQQVMLRYAGLIDDMYAAPQAPMPSLERVGA